MGKNKPKKKQNKDNDPYNMCKQACKEYFDTKRLKELYENELKVKPKKVHYDMDGEVYDITGLSAFQVIAVMTAIINDPKWIRHKIVYFLIKTKNNEKDPVDKIFKLKAWPTLNQPGNGVVSVLHWHREKKVYIDNGGKTHHAMNEALAQTPPRTFADVIQKLFKDNASEIEPQEDIIAEEYFLLLFEIARRLSNKEYKTPEGKALDDLPIGIAIARKIKTLAAKSEATGLKAELTSLSPCFISYSNSRKETIQQLFESDNAERPTTLISCKRELEKMFSGSPVPDLELDKFSREDIDDSAMEEKSIPSELERVFCRSSVADLKLDKLSLQDTDDKEMKRLTRRLRKKNLRPHNVEGDGACFFRAVSHQLYEKENEHREVRMAGVQHIEKFPQNFVEWIKKEEEKNKKKKEKDEEEEDDEEKETVERYTEEMSQDSTWCDHIIMQAVANAKNLVIHVIQPRKTHDVDIYPQGGENPREIIVGYINGNHYVSVDPI